MRFARTVCVYTCSFSAGQRLVRRVPAEHAALMCASGEAVVHVRVKKLITSIRIVRTAEGLRRIGEPTGYRSSTTQRIRVEERVIGSCCGKTHCPVCKGSGIAIKVVPVTSREQKPVYRSERWAYMLTLTACLTT